MPPRCLHVALIWVLPARLKRTCFVLLRACALLPSHAKPAPNAMHSECSVLHAHMCCWLACLLQMVIQPPGSTPKALRCVVFSHSGMYLLASDDLGCVRLLQSNMDQIAVYQPHRESAR